MKIELSKRSSNQEALAYRLALWQAPSMTPALFHLLHQHLLSQKGLSLKALFETPLELQSLLEKLPVKLQDYLRQPEWQRVEVALEWAEQPSCFIICMTDPHYPFMLKEIVDAPPVLFVKGHLPCLVAHQIAIVGSRHATLPGRELAYKLSSDLAEAGLTITSGLAMGIDAAAHAGCLSVQGQTVAVLGTGINTVYPRSHTSLADRIANEGGALVSEFPIDSPPQRAHFPRRNRVMSGLSLGVVVVEASLKSGSLITARLAASQGREVFAVPGSPGHPLARGTHHLIQEGAKLTETAEDVLEELPCHIKKQFNKNFFEDKQQSLVEKLDRDESKLLKCVGFGPTGIDVIINRSQLAASKVAGGLLRLELKGYISAIAGSVYVRKRV